jgi:polyhydroxyalkanoate synthesis regulator protein
MANPINMIKAANSYRQAQKKMRDMKVAGASKDETVAVMLDGTMKLIAEVGDGFKELTADKMARNIEEAYAAAQKALQAKMQSDTSIEDLKKMLGAV